jgi:hypothetical protein
MKYKDKMIDVSVSVMMISYIYNTFWKCVYIIP